jgi:hypothetical protein
MRGIQVQRDSVTLLLTLFLKKHTSLVRRTQRFILCTAILSQEDIIEIGVVLGTSVNYTKLDREMILC